MLYLNPPYHIINGVSVFSDHADPLQYYYLPVMPKLTQVLDQTTGERVPQIQLIAFKGEAGTGGFLNFDVNLGIEQDALDDIAAEVKRLQRLRDNPRLAPVPLVDGTVKLLLLDKASDDEPPDPASPPSGPTFVARINHHTKPALFGNNQATFSVQLEKEGVTIMERALQMEMTPIGVVYSLEYLALRPAYSFRIHADWDRVQKHFHEQFSSKIFFSSVQIDEVVDQLIENQVIKIELDTFVPDDDDSGVIGRRDQAVNELKDMVLDNFFEPSLDPISAEQDGWDKALHVAERSALLAATGGWGGVAQFGYKKVDMTRIDKKKLNASMTERTTVKRTIYPQAHLQGLFKRLRDTGPDLTRFIQRIDLDDDWWERRVVNVHTNADFAKDDISLIEVRLRYGNEAKSVRLAGPQEKGRVDWSSLHQDGVMLRDVQTSFKVSFKGGNQAERPLSLESEPVVVDTEEANIDPRKLYSLIDVPVYAAGFPWETYPQVSVQLRYQDEENGIRQNDTVRLKLDDEEKVWRQFVLNPERLGFQYKITYLAADHRDIEQPWVTTEEQEVRVRNPRAERLSLTVNPFFDWSQLSAVFVDVSYEDKPNRLKRRKAMRFDAQNSVPDTFTVDLANPDHRIVTVKTTVVTANHAMRQLPLYVTESDFVILTADMLGHRIVSIRPDEAGFDTVGLDRMKVEVLYKDEEAGLHFEDNFTFRSSKARGAFEFDFAADEKDRFEYRVTYVFTNGVTRTTDWQSADSNELVLPLS